MKVILDTNCYISYISKRHAAQHKQMVEFWEEVSRLEYEVVLTGHNISELVFVLNSVYDVSVKEIKTIISDLMRNPGVVFESGHFPGTTLELWPDPIKDYGDAVLAAAASNLQAKVFTFDAAFVRGLNKLNLLAHIS